MTKQIIPACNEKANHQGLQNEGKKEPYRSVRESLRITEWLSLAGASGESSLCSKQSEPQQVTRVCILLGLEDPQGWSHHNLSGQTGPVVQSPL